MKRHQMWLTGKIFKTSKDIIAKKNELLTKKVFKIEKACFFNDLHTFAFVTHPKIFIHLENSSSCPNTRINAISSVFSALTLPPSLRDLNVGASILETTLLTLKHKLA